MLWVPVFVCLYIWKYKYSTFFYLKNGKKLIVVNKHRRDILIITLFVGSSLLSTLPSPLIRSIFFHSSFSLRSLSSLLSPSSYISHFLNIDPSDQSFLASSSSSSYPSFRIPKVTRFIEKKKEIILEISARRERNQIVIVKDGHESSSSFIKKKKKEKKKKGIQTRIVEESGREECVHTRCDARWLSYRVGIIILRRTKLIQETNILTWVLYFKFRCLDVLWFIW